MAENHEFQEIFSKKVRAGRRTYFFDVRSTKAEDYYMTITESIKENHDEGAPSYRKHKIYLYKEDFKNFKVDLKVMNCAKKNAIFLHCLPRGNEVSNDVFLSKYSKVWQQAFNRVFVQKSILLYCLGKLR